MSDSQPMSYVGICRACDGVMMLTVDEADRRDSVADEVADCIRYGYIVERLSVEDARERAAKWCECSVQEGIA